MIYSVVFEQDFSVYIFLYLLYLYKRIIYTPQGRPYGRKNVNHFGAR